VNDHLLENYNQNRYNGGKSGDLESDWMFDVTSAEAPSSNMDEAWDKLSQKITPEKKITKSFPILKIAASVALIAVSIFVFKGYFIDSVELVVRQSGDEKTQVTFPDGSRAVLNVNSQVKFLGEFGSTREVQFSGEAYFDIEKSDKPFVIKMGDINVRILGTAFNLVADDSKISVLVDRGLVALEKGSDQVKIRPGELGVFNTKTSEISIDKTPPANVMSWRNGEFSFQDATLDKVTIELASYYDVTFQVSDAGLKCKITADFNNAPIEDVLKVLETILGVSIRSDNSNIRIKGIGCQ